jgi:hypothetical protein
MLRQRDAGWLNPRILVTFVLIFICGLMSGSIITDSIIHSRMRQAQANGDLGLNQLKVRLQLTPDQQAIVAHELDDYAKYYQNIEEEREDVAEHGKRRILSVLNPEQKKIFLEIFRTQPLPTSK